MLFAFMGRILRQRNNLPVEYIHINRTKVLKLSKTNARGTREMKENEMK